MPGGFRQDFLQCFLYMTPRTWPLLPLGALFDQTHLENNYVKRKT